MRSFALTLHFYSPRAYEYLRKMYENNLQRTIRKWYESVDGKPGCTSESLVALKIRTKAAAVNGKKIICNLVMDEMSIRRQIIYNTAVRKYYGYCDFGNGLNANEKCNIVKEVLIFLSAADIEYHHLHLMEHQQIYQWPGCWVHVSTSTILHLHLVIR